MEDFKFKYNNISPKQGRILISEPFLNDMYFKRSVVLLTEHNQEGSVGFVLNKPLKMNINELITDFPEIQANVTLGGPVNTNTLHYIHTLSDKIRNSIPVMKGLYWGGDFDAIRDHILVNGFDPKQVRFFLGYSGWAPGQLENELQENFWIVTDLNPLDVMTSYEDQVWNNVLAEMGGEFQVWANSPANPSFN